MTDDRFDGETFEQDRDGARLTTEMAAVKRHVMDGYWHYLHEISTATGYPEASISARLRDLRKRRFGSYIVEREYVQRGLHRYRVLVPTPKQMALIGDPSMNVHPVADLFPMLTPEELADLAADIKAHGLLNDIVVDKDGNLLDGRNRLAACELAGVEPRFTTYEGDDPAGYALAVNIARRHLSKGQIAMIAVESLPVSGKTQDATAKSLGISQQRISQAAIVKQYTPERVAAVIAGASLDEAYEDARLVKASDETTQEQLDELRKGNPDLADLVVEGTLTLKIAVAQARQREDDRVGRIRRSRERLNQLAVGWSELMKLPTNADRDPILDGMTDEYRALIERLEASL